jgi:voltage-gated potassium channel
MARRIFSTISHTMQVLLDEPLRRFQFSLLILAVLIASGSLGYMVLEQMKFIDALYMTVITVTTVGFGEVKPLSSVGRLYTIVLIVLGVGTAAWAVGSGVEIILGRKLWSSVQLRKLKELLMTLEDHYIVCGYGRIGRQITRDLQVRRIPFVVIDQSTELEEEFLENEILHIIGDATQDESLIKAGILRARGFVSALNSDADNVLAVLTAREMNPDLLIVARAMTESSENKLRRAGANRVVSPYSIGGHRLALALLQPAVHDFLQQIFNLEDLTVDIGQIVIREDSPMAGQTISDSDLRHIWKLTILAIHTADGTFTISPDAQHRLEPGETLIVIGNPTAIYKLESLQSGTTP